MLITHKNADAPILNPACFILFRVSMCARGHVLLGIEPKALGMLGKDSTTFLHPQTPNPVSVPLSVLSVFLSPAYPVS